MKKILCVLMALVTLLGVGGSFVSCKQEPTSEEVVRFPIISNGSSNYVIVYPEKASVSEIEAARLLREKIYELTGVRLKSLSE